MTVSYPGTQTGKGAFGRPISLMRMVVPTTKTGATPADRHPGFVYLASLASGSRRTMRQALDVMAGIVSGGVLDAEMRYVRVPPSFRSFPGNWQSTTIASCMFAAAMCIRSSVSSRSWALAHTITSPKPIATMTHRVRNVDFLLMIFIALQPCLSASQFLLDAACEQYETKLRLVPPLRLPL